MPDIIEVNAVTGEVIERDFTPEEAAQRAKDLADWEEAKQIAADEAAAKEAAKASALAKLQALGLTEAEAAAIAGF